MRVVALLALCVALVVVTDAATSVRFLSTVPATVSTNAVDCRAAQATYTVTHAAAAAGTYTTAPILMSPSLAAGITSVVAARNVDQDVVGLKAFTDSSSGLSSGNRVLTAPINIDPTAATNDYYGAWHNGMLPLTADHSVVISAGGAAGAGVATQQAVAINNICIAARFEGAAAAAAVNTAVGATTDVVDGNRADHYYGEGLRADGIAGYLSFAAGTYDFGAYGVIGASCGSSSPGSCTVTPVTASSPVLRTEKDFASSRTKISFEDNKIYNVVAVGSADWVNAGSSTWAPSVKLLSFEERTASAKFHHGAVRFMHALADRQSQVLSVYSGRTVGAAVQIASGIAFGSTSDYVDIRAFTAQIFPLSTSDGSSSSVIAQGVAVTANILSGMVATSVCAVSDHNLAVPFCRLIPSRVVAYVRLVHDMNNQLFVNDGAVQRRAADTTIGLYASYVEPNGLRSQAYRQGVAVAAPTMAPILAPEDRYAVVEGVTASTVSGFGEVHVPIPIMDTAQWPSIALNFAAAPTTGVAAIAGVAITQVDSVSTKLVYKRVSLMIMTAGMTQQLVTAKLTTAVVTGSAAAKTPTPVATLTSYLASATSSLDAELGPIKNTLDSVFLDPGTAATVSWSSSGGAAAVTVTSTTTATQLAALAHDPDDILIGFGVEASVATMATLPSNSMGRFNLANTSPYNSWIVGDTAAATGPDLYYPTVNGVNQGSGTTPTSTWTLIINQMGPNNDAGQIVDLGVTVGVAPQSAVTIPRAFDSVAPGTYSYTRGTTTDVTSAAVCAHNTPAIAFTVETDSIVSLFSLNQFACIAAASATTTGSTTSKETFAAKWELAASTPAAAAAAAAATPFFGTASAVSTPLALLFAAVLAILAVSF